MFTNMHSDAQPLPLILHRLTGGTRNVPNKNCHLSLFHNHSNG